LFQVGKTANLMKEFWKYRLRETKIGGGLFWMALVIFSSSYYIHGGRERKLSIRKMVGLYIGINSVTASCITPGLVIQQD
jgi:hypothetical protein